MSKKTFLSNLQEKFIEYINSDYKKYNRPLLLSVTVFVISYVIALGIFASIIKQCSFNISTLDYFQLKQQIVWDKFEANCMYWTAVLGSNNSVGGCYLKDSVPFTFCGTPDKTVTCDVSNNPLIMFSYEKCPKVLDSLGTSFGYVSILNSIISILMIFIFTKFGWIKMVEVDKNIAKEMNDIGVRIETSPQN